MQGHFTSLHRTVLTCSPLHTNCTGVYEKPVAVQSYMRRQSSPNEDSPRASAAKGVKLVLCKLYTVIYTAKYKWKLKLDFQFWLYKHPALKWQRTAGDYFALLHPGRLFLLNGFKCSVYLVTGFMFLVN